MMAMPFTVLHSPDQVPVVSQSHPRSAYSVATLNQQLAFAAYQLVSE